MTSKWKHSNKTETTNKRKNQSIFRFDVILQRDWPIKQSLLHIRVFFGGKTERPCFDLFIHWLIKQMMNTYRNHSSRSYENRSNNKELFVIDGNGWFWLGRNYNRWDQFVFILLPCPYLQTLLSLLKDSGFKRHLFKMWNKETVNPEKRRIAE